MTRKTRAVVGSPWSKTATTLGWSSRAAARASRTNRSANSSSSPRPGCITLTAQVRSSRRSVASYTLAIPPRAMRGPMR